MLRRPLGLSLYDENLSGEGAQLHFGLFDAAIVLRACLIAVPVSSEEVKLRQMAVQTDCHAQGFGQRILREIEKIFEKQSVNTFCLHARLTAIGFYEKSGYVVTGCEFVEVGILHVKMLKLIGA